MPRPPDPDDAGHDGIPAGEEARADALARELRDRATSGRVHLDLVAELLGPDATMGIIEQVIGRVTEMGISITTDEVSARDELRTLLSAERMLRSELGRRPTARELDARSGLSAEALRRARILARVIASG